MMKWELRKCMTIIPLFDFAFRVAYFLMEILTAIDLEQIINRYLLIIHTSGLPILNGMARKRSKVREVHQTISPIVFRGLQNNAILPLISKQ